MHGQAEEDDRHSPLDARRPVIPSTFALLLALCCVVLPASLEARPRIGFLTLSAPDEGQQLVQSFIEGLRRLGYAPDRDVDIQYGYAAGNVDRLIPLALQLMAFQPDVLVGSEPSPCRALKSLAPTLPIVCLALTSALIPELIASYSRPGGNVTGMAVTVEGLTGKLVEVAREILPGAVRIGFLSNPTGASMGLFTDSIEEAARAAGATLVTASVAAPTELTPAFELFSTQGVQAVVVPLNGLFRAQRIEIAHGPQQACLRG
ncbi:MAG: ABC transporter substrate binding protein [Xanthobacteraceae bacterium]